MLAHGARVTVRATTNLVARATVAWLWSGTPLIPRKPGQLAMSRRKHLAVRKPAGRIYGYGGNHTSELLPPTEIRRLVDAASAGLRDSIWSSTLGRLHLTGKISASQFSAGKRWAELVSNYSQACLGPRPPRTEALDHAGGTPADPDSAAGAREVRRHERATASYLEGRHALRLAGREAEHVVESVCVADQAPAGWRELEALRTGLQSLSTWWRAKRK